MVRTKVVELPEGHIADIQDGYKYLGVPQANGNYEEATRKSAKATTSKADPEKPAEWEERDPSHEHICPTSHQIPRWHNKLANGGDRGH